MYMKTRAGIVYIEKHEQMPNNPIIIMVTMFLQNITRQTAIDWMSTSPTIPTTTAPTPVTLRRVRYDKYKKIQLKFTYISKLQIIWLDINLYLFITSLFPFAFFSYSHIMRSALPFFYDYYYYYVLVGKNSCW